MNEIEIKNATIEKTMLGYEDHGIFTFLISLDYGNSGQGFGDYTLGGEVTDQAIQGILKVLKLNSWEELKGIHVRVKATNTKVHEIGHFLEDRWFNPKLMEFPPC